jgi:hypothetical protein
MADLTGLRAQILGKTSRSLVKHNHDADYRSANAQLMVVRPAGSPPPATLPSLNSIATMVSPSNTSSINTPRNDKIDVVVFGAGNEFIAAIMLGITPAVEGASGTTPEAALRKLLLATCELLDSFMPKVSFAVSTATLQMLTVHPQVGSHQRNIHGGGVFDEDTISIELMQAQKKSP